MICYALLRYARLWAVGGRGTARRARPNLPAKIVPAKITRLGPSRELPADVGIPPLNFKTPLESNPLKSGVSVWRLAERCVCSSV